AHESAPAKTHNTTTAGPTHASARGASALQSTATNGRRGLLIDWGGVLTTNLFTSFGEFCTRNEIDPAELGKRFSADPQFRELLISLEKGTIEESDFEESFAELLGVDSDELFDGVLISGVEGTRKPAKRMYELGAERAGVAAELCVFVDDLPFNLTP